MTERGRRFIVYALPEGKPRPRFFRLRNRVGTYSPKTAFDMACQFAARSWRPREPFAGPVSLELAICFPRPKSRRAELWHATRPDADNVAKSVMDALTRAGWWGDDGQVASLKVFKQYETPATEAGVVVSVEPLKETTP